MVRAEDGGHAAARLASTAAVKVTVLDVNDNPPRIQLEEGREHHIPDSLRKGKLHFLIDSQKIFLFQAVKASLLSVDLEQALKLKNVAVQKHSLVKRWYNGSRNREV